MVRNSVAPVTSAPRGDEYSRHRTPRITQRALQRCIKNVDWATTAASPQSMPELTQAESLASPQLNPHARPFVPGPKDAETESEAGYSQPATTSSPPALRLIAAAHMIPHPAKAHKGGEDAYFICDDGNTLGIADGVGGWEALGVDSGLYSRSLMGFCAEAVSSGLREPLDVLKAGHDRSACIQGSTTACIVSLTPNASLSAVNLGDSGFVLIRSGTLLYRTKEQQHFFNCPFQIGSSRDQPDDAQRLIVENVQDGDIVIACTDGVFDNLFTEDIVRIASEYAHLGPHAVARRVAEASFEVAQNADAFTPFQDGALKAGQLWKGGKLDDITVVAAIISNS